MSGTNSEALRTFHDALAMFSSLLELDRGYSRPPKKHEMPFVVGLRGGAAVLAIAAFEQFLKSLFEENLEKLNPNTVDFFRLPDNIRITTVYVSLETAMKGSSHGAAGTKLDRLTEVMDVCRRAGAGVVDVSAFCGTSGNPNPDNVKQMFKNVGVPDLFLKMRPEFDKRWRKPESADFIRDKLDEIVRRRHLIAHGGDALNVTRQQLKETRRFLSAMAFVLERLLRQHIHDVIVKAKVVRK